MESVEIAGITGVIEIHQETYTSKEYSYTFIRSEAGETVLVPEGTEIITEGSTKGRDYLPVIFIGTNGGYSGIDGLISQQRAIIDHQTANNDRFIIVGLHTGTAEEQKELEAAMVVEYGDKYINLREYMSTQAMDDAGLTPTAQDKEMMDQGMTPASLLRDDGLHFNATAYELIGNLIYARMDQLGYFDDAKLAISEAMK